MRKDRKNSAAVVLLLILFILIFFLSQILLQREEDVPMALPQGGDLAVIGGSTAALITALEGLEAGAQVFLFPDGAELLEDLRLLVSEGLAAPSAPAQEEGREDGAEIVFGAAELKTLIETNGKGVANPQLLEAFETEADLLPDMALEYGGIVFDFLPDPEAAPYLHLVSSPDAERKFRERLLEKISKEGVDIRPEKIKEIVLSPKEEGGGVRMLILENEEGEVTPFYIQGAVLADGGYSGDIFPRHEYLMRNNLLTLRPEQKGEGIRLAQSLGANFLPTSYLGFKVFLLQPQTGQIIEIPATARAGAFFFNSEGRFLEGEAATNEVADFILHSPDGEVFLLTTEDMGWEYSRFFSFYNSPDRLMANYALKEAAFPRILYQGGAYYTARVNAGVYYTPGGLSVTSLGEVKNVEGNIIPGLYAAGEITGGLHGEGLLPGMALSETLFSARRAGRSAAEYASR